MNLKLVTGLLLIGVTLAVGIMCIVSPNTYDIVGNAIQAAQQLSDLHWAIMLLVMLAGSALGIYAVIQCAEENLFAVIAIICYAVVGLVITALTLFNVYPDIRFSLWYNVIPLGLLLISLIFGLSNEHVKWWQLLLTFFGFAAAICVGCALCILLAAIIYGLVAIAVFALLFAILGAVLSN